MTITGQSQTGTIINGTSTSRLFTINSDATVILQNLTFVNGYAADYGGAIYNEGNCSIENCTFRSNNAINGGALFNGYTATCNVKKSTFTGNNAVYSGGAIYNLGYSGGSFTAEESVFIDNTAQYGGAIANYGICNLTSNTFTGNTATATDGTGGNAIWSNRIETQIHFNRFVKNENGGYDVYSIGYAGLDNNWWGTNFERPDPYTIVDPNTAGRTNIQVLSWIVLQLTASTNSINPSGTSTITVDLIHNSNGETLSGKLPDGMAVEFACDGSGSVLPTSSAILTQATTTFTAGTTLEDSIVSATVDDQTVNITIQVLSPRHDIYVATDGSDTTGDGSSEHPFQSLSKAIEEISTGTVHIRPGTYSGSKNTDIVISKNITITGQSQTGTIINGTNSEHIFHVYPADVHVTIQNLTFANAGVANGDEHQWGGAIANDGYLTVVNCAFINNTSPMGGAIWSDVELIVNNCTFTGNTATVAGGAIFINECDCTISGCTFTDNSAEWGGAILNSGNCTVNFSRFYGNSASNGSAILNVGNPVNAENNWWSSNADPLSIHNLITTTLTVNGKQMNGGAVDADPWIIMAYSASPTTIPQGATSTLTVDLTHNSNHEDISAQGHIPDGTPITFATNLGNVGSKSIVIRTLNGAAAATLRGDEAAGEALTSAILDGQVLTDIVTITSVSSPNTNVNSSPTDNGVSSVNKAHAATKTIPLRHTGLPLAGLVLAVLAVFGGLVTSKKF